MNDYKNNLNLMLRMALPQLRYLVNFKTASIFGLDVQPLTITGNKGWYINEYLQPISPTVLETTENQLVKEGLASDKALIVADLWEKAGLSVEAVWLAFSTEVANPNDYPIRSWLGIPLVFDEQLLGLIALRHPQPNYFTERHIRLANTILVQANETHIRLYKRAETQAIQEERQRLARELHDSVTQALYGIELGINTALTLLQRGFEAGKIESQLKEVLMLAELGQTEMRSLLLELRPEALQAEGIVAALFKTIEASAGRYSYQVKSDLGQEPAIPIEYKEALYRIGQESLNNAGKHSRASAVTVQLTQQPDSITLEVHDNGRGFDPETRKPGHLGLDSMHERASRLNGHLTIDSEPGQGTQVTVWLPLPAKS